MADINWYSLVTGYDYDLRISGSGIGFFSSLGFGKSINVGDYQSTNFVTDGNGAINGAQINSIKYVHPNSGEVAGGLVLALQKIPNYQGTANIRVTSTDAIQVQNANLYIYDRVNINNPQSGVVCKVAELIHVGEDNTVTGSGDDSWITAGGSGSIVPLSASPGLSGAYSGNGLTSTRADTTHDWYVAISASPSTIGAKTMFGAWFQGEFI